MTLIEDNNVKEYLIEMYSLDTIELKVPQIFGSLLNDWKEKPLPMVYI
jgi:hypothetical protein